MKAKVKVSHYNKDLRVIGEFEQDCHSFLMGLVEQLYALMASDTTYDMLSTAQGEGALTGFSENRILAACGFGEPHGAELGYHLGTNSVNPIRQNFGIILGGEDAAVTANQISLVDPVATTGLQDPFRSSFPVRSNMWGTSNPDITYDYQNDEIAYICFDTNPPRINRIHPFTGALIAEQNCDFLQAAGSSSAGITEIDDFWLVITQEPAGSFIGRKINKATMITAVSQVLANQDCYFTITAFKESALADPTIIVPRTGGAVSSRRYSSVDWSYLGLTPVVLGGTGDRFGWFKSPSGENYLVSLYGAELRMYDDVSWDRKVEYDGTAVNLTRGCAVSSEFLWSCRNIPFLAANTAERYNLADPRKMINGATVLGPQSHNPVDGYFELWADFYNRGLVAANIKEVGIQTMVNPLSTTNQCSASLIARDVLGIPVNVLPGEILRVTYQIQSSI